MATAYLSRSAALPNGGRRATPALRWLIFDFVLGLFDQLKAKRDRQRTIAELSRLSDHVLEDIGVRRADIWAAADASASASVGRRSST